MGGDPQASVVGAGWQYGCVPLPRAVLNLFLIFARALFRAHLNEEQNSLLFQRDGNEPFCDFWKAHSWILKLI